MDAYRFGLESWVDENSIANTVAADSTQTLSTPREMKESQIWIASAVLDGLKEEHSLGDTDLLRNISGNSL